MLAKSHFASTDNNDFIIRVHLGFLHYASAVYTTALCNLSKHSHNLKWFKDDFIDRFAYGLLQINFLANLTLVDYKSPIAERTIYLRAEQSVPLIQQENAKFNILDFSPDMFASDCYESESVHFSKKYYEKISFFVEYLFEKNKSSWEGRTEELGTFIYNQLISGSSKLDGLPKEICTDKTPNTLKKLLKNLAYLWIVHHGETFSIISVVNMYYFCPTFLRKPLSEFPNKVMSDADKQEWMAPLQVITDSMLLSKQVTFRKDPETIVSQWVRTPVDQTVWKRLVDEYEQKHNGGKDSGMREYENFWNSVCIEANEASMKRSNAGLFYLHWLMPHEMPNALNI